ncbi:YadA-like family protein [Caballeronia sp. LZ034LL]|uniref:beta strand repeat-containing protein n=1 Tax=Caballeronia sp. LZ034LL TaxID=3038567 RepID=UPI00285CA847|nr:YadA-like family protein [Caballeronia sp. LZ034LL]MDR5833017.1 YadA-like family protein [Caballeronia sp. LZ034LL]
MNSKFGAWWDGIFRDAVRACVDTRGEDKPGRVRRVTCGAGAVTFLLSGSAWADICANNGLANFNYTPGGVLSNCLLWGSGDILGDQPAVGTWTAIGSGGTQIVVSTTQNKLAFSPTSRYMATMSESANGGVLLSGIGAGVSARDAVNVGQVSPVVAVLGGGASLSATTGAITLPSYALVSANLIAGTSGAAGDIGTGFLKVDAALGALNTSVANNTTSVANITNQLNAGGVGLVQLDGALGTVTVAKDSAGTTVDISGIPGTRTLTGLTNGLVSGASTQAVNGSQLFSLSGSAAAALGGGATVAIDGTIVPPTFTVGGLSVNSVGAALSNIDARTTQNLVDIDDISAQINIGATGLVRQDPLTRNITVASASDGATVDFRGLAGARTLVGLADGAVNGGSTEAVNGSQLFAVSASAAAALGGGSSVDANGLVTMPTYTLNGQSVQGVEAAFTNLDGRTTQNTTDISTINTQISSGTIGLVQQDVVSRVITVAKDTDGAAVDFTGTGGGRTLTGVANGAVNGASNDAVNGSQLFAVSASAAAALGGGSSVDANGLVTVPTYTLNGQSVQGVEAGFSNIDGRTTQNTGDITNNTAAINDITNQINNGTVGLVQQDPATRTITVGKDADGSAVDFTGTGVARTLTGVANGAVNGVSNEAVNGSQLFAVSASAAAALGGGSSVDMNGLVTMPTYTLNGQPVQGVEAAFTNLDGRTTQNSTDISTINTQLSSGTIGLVQQDAISRAITVAKDTDGASVDFTGTGGARTLTGVANGSVSSGSAEAVNGAQLFAVSASAAAALGGGSSVDANGLVTAPTYTLDGQSVQGVEAAFTNLDGRTTQNTGDITNNTAAINDITNQINNGTVGLVQQDPATRTITVAKDTDGSAVDFAGTGGARTLTGVANGAVNSVSSEAVNGSQLFASANSAASALGGGSSVDANGLVTMPTYTLNGQPVQGVEAAFTNLDGRTTQNTTDISTINAQLSSGTIGLVQQDAVSRVITVGKDTDGAAVDFTGSAGVRTLTGVSNGAVNSVSNDAVNGSQLFATANSAASALGGGSSVDGNGLVTMPAYSLDGQPVQGVEAAFTNLDGRTTQNTTDISTINTQLSDGTIGLVQQGVASRAITVAKNTDGAVVDFTGTAGVRTLTGVANGAVNSLSNEAVNGSQLFASANSAASALGGGSSVDANGLVTMPTYTLNGQSVQGVEAAFTNLDGRTTQNTGDITNNTAAINSITNQINNGTVGLVQQDPATRTITVAKATDGSTVDFTGTAGARTLMGVANGSVNGGSTEAVNGSQLFATASSAAAALGGGAAVDGNGQLIAPTYTLNGQSVQGVEAAFSNLDGRTTQNTADISTINTQISNGTIGLVQQDAVSRVITVAKSTDGTVVDFTGTAGPRTLIGVANGAVSPTSNQAVNGSQLHGLANSTAMALGGGSSVDANGQVTSPTYTLSGQSVQGVEAAFTNLDGRTSQNASNISNLQLNVANNTAAIEKNTTDIADITTQINSGTVGLVQQDPVSRKITVAQNANGTVVDVTGSEGTRTVTGVSAATLSADSTDAVNGSQLWTTNQQIADITSRVQNFSAGGSTVIAAQTNATPAVASGTNSTAIGNGANASGNNAVALGSGSVADQDNTVSIGAKGSERRLTNVAPGVNGTDAVNMNQLGAVQNSVNTVARQAFAGVAAAMAMPNLTPSAPGKTVVAVGVGNYKGYTAVGLGGTYRSGNNRWLVNGAASITPHGDTGVRGQVGYEF